MRAHLLVLLVCLAGCDNATPGAGSGSAAASGSAKAASKSASAAVSAKPAASSAAPTTASAAPSASAPVAAGPDLVFEGLKVLPSATADAKEKPEFKSIEVKPDGSVVADTGKSMLQFSKNELKDDKGNTLFAVAADGTISGKGITEVLKFNEKDEIVSDKGRIFIENGVPKFEDKSKGKTEDAPIKVEGVTEKNRRAALILVAAIFFSSEEPTVTTSPSSSAAVSAAPPPSVATPKAPAPPK